MRDRCKYVAKMLKEPELHEALAEPAPAAVPSGLPNLAATPNQRLQEESSEAPWQVVGTKS